MIEILTGTHADWTVGIIRILGNVDRRCCLSPIMARFRGCSSLSSAVIASSCLNSEWGNTSWNRQADFDFPPFPIVPGVIGGVAQDVLVAQFCSDVFSDPGKIVRIVKDVNAGSCQAADFGQKLWTEPLFQAP